MSLHKVMNFRRLLEHDVLSGSMKRKSSKIFTTFLIPNLLASIHFNAVENSSKNLHEEEQPIGRHLS